MKKKLGLISALALTFAMSTTVFAGTKVVDDVKVYHTNDNTFMNFNNDVINVDGTNFFPMRELLNNLGISNEDIKFDKETQTISFSNENYDVTFTIGQKEYVQNGVTFEMPVAPFINDKGVTYLPIRYVANSLGSKVGYDQDLKQILVTDIHSEYAIYRESDLPQFSELGKEETIATLHTNYGDITVRLFPEYAPLAVENFVTLAMDGYYDGVIFHRVINDFVIQGGDPTGTGMGGESIYGDNFVNEVTPSLRHFSGALAMANSGNNSSNGSQFYIVEADTLDDSTKEELELIRSNPLEEYEEGLYVQDLMSPVVADKFLEVGGIPYLDGAYTVFGQVVDGMDIVHKIADANVDFSDRPLEDIIINSIAVKEYK